MPNLVTTKTLMGMQVFDGRKGKRIGKVRHLVFHPSEKRCVGIAVKRPDAALMFHRKDLFVSLDGFHVEGKRLIVHDDSGTMGKEAIRSHRLDWDACVIWVGMPLITASGNMLGYIASVTFDAQTGAVESLTVENGVANDAILGTRTVSARFVKGFKRGIGMPLAAMGDYSGEKSDEAVERGAILVSDDALDLPVEGGAAAAAGKASAVVADKAKKGVALAKESAAAKTEKAKPAMQRVAKETGEAVAAGSFAVGKQLGRASGMFAAFKEEFEKAAKGEDD